MISGSYTWSYCNSLCVLCKQSGRDNIAMIIVKKSTPEKDKFYEYSCYMARTQGRFINTKLQMFRV